MVNNNEKKRTLKEAYYEELSKKLEENPPEIPTYEEFSTMIDSHLAKRHRRKMRAIGIAASLTVVLLASVLAFTYLTPDVGADKNPKEEIITEDGVIIEDGGYGSSDGEDNVWSTTEWAHVRGAKAVAPEILFPNYMPEGYSFDRLTVENFVGNDSVCEFKFYDEKENVLEIEIVIMEERQQSLQVENAARTINCEIGEIYIEDGESKIAIMQIDDGIVVYIFCNVSDKEIIDVMNGLTR